MSENKTIYSLLKFHGTDGPTYFVVRGTESADQKSEPMEERRANTAYFYGEHSCPTNWLRDCVMVAQNGDTDPHGFLEFVRFEEAPEWIVQDEEAEEFSEHNDDHLAKLFPEVLEKWDKTS